jgi:hypothetical protein
MRIEAWKARFSSGTTGVDLEWQASFPRQAVRPFGKCMRCRFSFLSTVVRQNDVGPAAVDLRP